uniref:Plant transposase n=1 Tax=Citrus limon TaxID=2708 RepID=A0A1S8ADN8_CITLI
MASRKKRGISMDGILWQQAESQRRASSSRLLTHVDEEDDSTQARQARGPALGVAQWGSGKIMHLDFNSEWQVIGPNSNKFKTQLGIIARNGHKVPLTYVEWIDMPENILKDIWKEVKDNTDAPDAYKSHCLRNIGKLWKNWKSRLKCDHYNNKTYVERIAFTPPRVVAEQWRTLVAYWGTEEAKATAEKNKTNRAQVSSVHRTGRTSFAIKREQMKKKGKKTDRISVFIETRSKPDGSIADPESVEIILSLNVLRVNFMNVCLKYRKNSKQKL